MSRRRHLVAIVLGLGAIAISFATIESPARALGSPFVAMALAGLATTITIDLRDRNERRR
jgi:hypothetical protein